ncbi:TetR/AcrR family transcriptional regulator [Nocardia veterana]|uniref:TetR/AcrR family transcriptional regulator n=1 Tax=Nocardia veterana TaxID=132249 RepID=A0A7X6RKJ2_9NOCA|nr:TetR/AcrR family transcriptional regulator [Nocardia veterana]NKY88714.1 TetR/AcrR family transcriptional regulator [Nocardia veterana]
MESAAPGQPTDPDSLLQRAYSAAVEGAEEDDDIRTRVLDAACEQFALLGVRRSTMDDVARRANVSRITVYRRFATKDALVEQVILREYRRYFDQFLVEIRQARSAADRVVLGFVSSLRAIRANPIIGGLLALEPDMLVGTMIGDQGRTVAMVSEFVAGQLRREQRAGQVSTEIDAELAAELMVRISASFLAIPSRLVDLDDEQQLADLARRYLVPMIEPPAGR